jgi:hypothetical protein
VPLPIIRGKDTVNIKERERKRDFSGFFLKEEVPEPFLTLVARPQHNLKKRGG